jgi:hypothetical protein
VTLTGPAEEICSGEVSEELLADLGWETGDAR